MGGNDLKDEDLEPGNQALRNRENLKKIRDSFKKTKGSQT
jgi:hypothetical protein